MPVYLCTMELTSIVHYGLLKYVEINGDVSLELLHAMPGYDHSCLQELVMSGDLNRSEDDIISIGNQTESELLAMFNEFRVKYPGSKRGIEPEFDWLKKKQKKWRRVVPTLLAELNRQMSEREEKLAYMQQLERSGTRNHGLYVAPWKNLKTYISDSCWTEVIWVKPADTVTAPTKKKSSDRHTVYLLKAATELRINPLSDSNLPYFFDSDQLDEWVDSKGAFSGRHSNYSVEWCSDFLWRCHRLFYNQQSFSKYRNVYGYTAECFKQALQSKA